MLGSFIIFSKYFLIFSLKKQEQSYRKKLKDVDRKCFFPKKLKISWVKIFNALIFMVISFLKSQSCQLRYLHLDLEEYSKI